MRTARRPGAALWLLVGPLGSATLGYLTWRVAGASDQALYAAVPASAAAVAGSIGRAVDRYELTPSRRALWVLAAILEWIVAWSLLAGSTPA